MTYARRTSSSPKMPLPAGAWDSHSHVFGPFDRYPLLEHRRYDPPMAPVADYLLSLDETGFDRGVLVHASAYGYDNGCTGDALVASAGRAVGIAVVEPSVKDAELERLHAQGFRGIRFTETGPRARAFPGSIGFAELIELAPRMRALGWHAQVWGNCARIVAAADQLAASGVPVVLDHMGYFETAAGVNDADFQRFLAMIRDGDFWVKLTVLRLAHTDPNFSELRPFHDALLRAIPDRVVFGSDWPYIGLDASPPDLGKLVDLFDAWTPDAALRTAILVDNPARLYGTGSAGETH